jgi:CMP-N,N'-diacetyllegionaminic acid synthase
MAYKILALIPARSGSKGIPHKNIRPLAGKPLLAYSVEHALTSTLINRVIVSTDSPAYAEIARRYGAETPFLRPLDISQDHSTDLEVFTHALQWLRQNQGYIPDVCVHLRPTHPIRKVEHIDKIVQLLLHNPEIDSVRSVTPAPETPFKMWFRGQDGLLSPVVQTDIQEAYNLPRQMLPQAFVQNACVDAVRTNVVLEKHSMTGERILGYVMDASFDIDNEEQFRRAEEYLMPQPVERKSRRRRMTNGTKTLCFDVDGVVATLTPDNQYDLAVPLTANVRLINLLYEQGHKIVLFTARGSASSIDWTTVTRNQLRAWGVKYHELLFGKPAADYYIDDRLITIEELRALFAE